MTFPSFPDNDITIDDRLYIEEIQEFLRALEMQESATSSVSVDGIFDPQTTAAVKKFQRQNGLPVTGVVNNATFVKMVEANNRLLNRKAFTVPIHSFPLQSGYIMRQGDRNDTVFFLNIMLHDIGSVFRNIPLPPRDENYSETTAAAVRAVQRALGIAATGLTNRQTWNGIAHLYNDLSRDFNALKFTGR